jgi:hypothetical protein
MFYGDRYGRDSQSGKWRCPAREQWGLGPHQKMTPELEDRVCLTATLTGSYEAAAQLAAKWGSAMNDETIRVHARRVGQRAEEQAQRRLRGGALGEPTVKVTGVKASPFALVIMMDGWLARQRGADWGDGSRQSNLERVAWREITTRGCPIGSGAMESFCSQLQGRFKRCGQFWSPSGMADLLALEIARRNLDWDALWLKN